MPNTYYVTYGNNVLTAGAAGSAISVTSADPYNPLGLPPYTIRLKYADGVTPTFSKGTAVQLSSSPNVWDLTYENKSWMNLLPSSSGSLVQEILGANSTGVTSMVNLCVNATSLSRTAIFDTSAVTSMEGMFSGCPNLTAVPLFDTSNTKSLGHAFEGCSSLLEIPYFNTGSVTSFFGTFIGCSGIQTIPEFNTQNVTNFMRTFDGCSSLVSVPTLNSSRCTKMDNMFDGCTSLKYVPLLNTDVVVSVHYMFQNCTAVESGALALYTQLSTQAAPTQSHYMTFYNCGSGTTTGAAELAQIPSDWK